MGIKWFFCLVLIFQTFWSCMQYDCISRLHSVVSKYKYKYSYHVLLTFLNFTRDSFYFQKYLQSDEWILQGEVRYIFQGFYMTSGKGLLSILLILIILKVQWMNCSNINDFTSYIIAIKLNVRMDMSLAMKFWRLNNLILFELEKILYHDQPHFLLLFAMYYIIHTTKRKKNITIYCVKWICYLRALRPKIGRKQSSGDIFWI